MAARNILMKSNLLPRYSVQDLLTKDTAEKFAEEGVESGSCPDFRGKVQIVGDARAGKTSLCKNLIGEQFNPREDPTFTLDTKKCRITPENKEWRIDKEGVAAELDGAVEWYILNKIASHFFWTGKPISKTVLVFAVCCFAVVPLMHGVWFKSFGGCLFEAGGLKSMPMLVFLSWLFLGPSLGYGQLNVMNAIWLNRIFTFIHLLISYTDEILAPSHPALTLIGLAFLMYVVGYLGTAMTRMMCLTLILMKIFGLWIALSAGDNPCHMAISDANEAEFFIFLFVFAVGVVTAVCGILHSQMLNMISTVVPILAYDTGNASITVAICGFVSGVAFVTGTVHGHPQSYYSDSLGLSVIVVLAGKHAFSYTFELVILGSETTFNADLVLEFFTQWVCYTLLFGLFFAVVDYFSSIKLPFFRSVTLNDLFQKLELVVSNHIQALERPIILNIFDCPQDYFCNNFPTLLTKTSTAVICIVFDITWYLKMDNREREFKRILYWLQSVRTCKKSSVVLVGTHIDQTNEFMVSNIQEFFKEKLQMSGGDKLRIIWNGEKPFFGIDNSRYLTDDSSGLRAKMVELTKSHPTLQTMIPIRWLKFLVHVHEVRKKACENQSCQNLVVRTFDLQLASFLTGISTTTDDFQQLLEYFHGVGEIFYDRKGEILSQFVVLDPILLPNVVQSLWSKEPTRQDKFLAGLQRLKHQGILECSLAKTIIGEKESTDFVQNVLQLLEAIGVIAKVASPELPADEASSCEDVYVVPSQLPKGTPIIPLGTHMTHRYYFDFGDFSISTFFFRLLARCLTLSELPYEMHGQRYLYRNSGLFTLGHQYFFCLSWIEHSSSQNLVELAFKVGHNGDPLKLLHRIWQLIQTLRKQEFSGMKFHCGPICPHEKPHQSNQANHFEDVHVLEVANSSCFPESLIFPMCHGRETEETKSYNDCLASTVISIEEEATVQYPIDVKGDNNIVISNSNIHTLVFNQKTQEETRLEVDHII